MGRWPVTPVPLVAISNLAITAYPIAAAPCDAAGVHDEYDHTSGNPRLPLQSRRPRGLGEELNDLTNTARSHNATTNVGRIIRNAP